MVEVGGSHTPLSPPVFLAQPPSTTVEMQELEPGVHNESDLIEIATRLACEGYWEDIKQVMEVSRVFRYDEQLWDAMKDEPGGGKEKRTRLMYAVLKGDLERVRFLLDRGARVNKGCLNYGYTDTQP